MELIPLSQAPATCLRSWFWCFTFLLAVLQDWNLSQSKLYLSTDVFKLLQTCLIHSEPTFDEIYIYIYINTMHMLILHVFYIHIWFYVGMLPKPSNSHHQDFSQDLGIPFCTFGQGRAMACRNCSSPQRRFTCSTNAGDADAFKVRMVIENPSWTQGGMVTWGFFPSKINGWNRNIPSNWIRKITSFKPPPLGCHINFEWKIFETPNGWV